MSIRNEKPTHSAGPLRRLWQSRRSFRGFGLLLFYCHMLMLFSFMARTLLSEMPEYAVLISAGRILVPTLFAITTASLFLPRFFWLGLALGFLHIPLAAYLLFAGPAVLWPWLLGLFGLMGLLLISLRVKTRS